MQPKKLVATGLATAILLVASVLGAVQLGQYPSFLGEATATGFTPKAYIVVGKGAAPQDVVGAIDLGADLQQLSYVTRTAAGAGAAQVTGGVSLDTADTKLYLTDVTNKAKNILTVTDLPTFLASGSVEDTSGTKYQYSQYLNIGGKQIQYAQPDPSSGLKDPAYLIKLGTSPDASTYLVQGWVSFTKPFNATKAIGKELVLFGKSFTISADTGSSSYPNSLVLFGTTGKETINAGETKTITVGTTTYTVQVVGVIDSSSAVISVNGIQKEVTEGTTYDFGGTSVYVSDVFYYKVPTETGSVVVSIGADRYVLENGQKIKHGTSGNEESIEGTYVSMDNIDELSNLMISFDAYTASPAVDYIKAGTVWTDPIFGIKVAYNGPATTDSEQISIMPGAANYYTITFTDKYGKSGTLTWIYDPNTASAGDEKLADSTGNDIIVVEGNLAQLNQYIFATSSQFPHMLKVTSIEVTEGGSNDVVKVTLKDVFSGVEYKVEKSGAIGTLTSLTTLDKALVIDGIKYDVLVQDVSGVDKVGIVRDGATTTVVYPVLYTKYGATIALTKQQTLSVTVTNATGSANFTLPTGTVYFREASDGTLLQYSTDGSTYTNITAANNYLLNVTLGRVAYTFQVDSVDVSGDSMIDYVKIKDIDKPAILLVEEKTKADKQDAIILPVYDNTGASTPRLELQSISLTHLSGDMQSSTSVGGTSGLDHYVTEWGTKVVYDKSSGAAGTATITYPDTQVYHLVAVGSNPSFTTTTAGVTYNEAAPLLQSIAKLDTDIMDYQGNIVDTGAVSNYNLVLVGGPCVNVLAWKLVQDGKLDASYACGGSAWTPGTAYVIAVDNAFATGKVALLVAGTSAADTKLATDVLSQGKIPATYTGSSAKITGTITSPTITPV